MVGCGGGTAEADFTLRPRKGRLWPVSKTLILAFSDWFNRASVTTHLNGWGVEMLSERFWEKYPPLTPGGAAGEVPISSTHCGRSTWSLDWLQMFLFWRESGRGQRWHQEEGRTERLKWSRYMVPCGSGVRPWLKSAPSVYTYPPSPPFLWLASLESDLLLLNKCHHQWPCLQSVFSRSLIFLLTS